MKLGFFSRGKKTQHSPSSSKKTIAVNQRALTVALIIALLFGAWFLRRYFSLIVVSAILTYLFYPLNLRLAKKFKRKGSAANLTMLISFVIIVIPFILIAFLTYFQLKNLATSLPSNETAVISEQSSNILSKVNDQLAKIPGTNPITPQEVSSTLNNFVSTAAANIAKWIASSVGGFIAGVTTFIIFIYVYLGMLMNGETIVKTIKDLNPLGTDITEKYFAKMGAMTKAMVRGQFIIATLQGLAGALSFYVIGYHSLFGFLWIIFAVLCLIPLGSGIIIIPAGIIMILTGNITDGLVVLGTHFLITTNIDNVLRPRLVPQSARLNPALTILSVFGGVAMFGFLGIVIGPVIMIVIATTVEMYLEADRTNRVTV